MSVNPTNTDQFKSRYANIILMRGDFISFFAGIVVSGYVVSISLNPGNTIWHWLTIAAGLAIGGCCFVLTRYAFNYKSSFKVNSESANGIQDPMMYTWMKDIREGAQPILGIPATRWIIWSPLLIVALWIAGIYSLNRGSRAVQQQEDSTKNTEHVLLAHLVDSVVQHDLHAAMQPLLQPAPAQPALVKDTVTIAAKAPAGKKKRRG